MPKSINATCKGCRLSKLKCDRGENTPCGRCVRLGLHCVVEARMHGKLNAMARLAPAVRALVIDEGAPSAERELLQPFSPEEFAAAAGTLVPARPAVPRAQLPLPQSQLADKSGASGLCKVPAMPTEQHAKALLGSLAARGERAAFRVLLGETVRLAHEADNAGMMSWALGLAHEWSLPLSLFAPFRPPARATLVRSASGPDLPPVIADLFESGDGIAVCHVMDADQHRSLFSRTCLAQYPELTSEGCHGLVSGAIHPEDAHHPCELHNALWSSELSTHDEWTRCAELHFEGTIRTMVPGAPGTYVPSRLRGRIAVVEAHDGIPDTSYVCCQWIPVAAQTVAAVAPASTRVGAPTAVAVAPASTRVGAPTVQPAGPQPPPSPSSRTKRMRIENTIAEALPSPSLPAPFTPGATVGASASAQPSAVAKQDPPPVVSVESVVENVSMLLEDSFEGSAALMTDGMTADELLESLELCTDSFA